MTYIAGMYDLPKDKQECISLLNDILIELEKNRKPSGFVITGYCSTYGMITVDMANPGFCNDPKCVMCNSFHEAMKKELKQF